MRRRDFLRILGGTLVGTELGCTPRERNPEQPAPSAPETTDPLRTTEDPVDPVESTENEQIKSVLPRISAELEVRIRTRMEELVQEGEKNFGAYQHFDRAIVTTHQGEPLIDTVVQTFQERIKELPEFQNMSPATMQWMIDLCCYGQVTAESSWNIHAVGTGSDRGLWQITDTASAQIAIERRHMEIHTVEVDRYDPIDATKGAAEYLHYMLRALRPWIDKQPGEESTPEDSDELNIFDLVNETEFIIPLIVTGYKCGQLPLQRALSSFYRSNPDTSKIGLDVFFSFIDYIQYVYRPTEPRYQIEQSTLDYFIKSLALRRIYEERYS